MSTYYPISQPFISDKELEYVTDAVKSGWVSSLGKYIELFETSFAKFCDVKYALTVNNGTTGLHLALEVLGVTAGDEVIIPDLTFVATANAVAYTGAKPVLVDIDPDTLCISLEAIKKAITPRTKAIIPVHLYGHPANMSEINTLAKQHNLFVIEDAAEAHGAECNGKRVGSLSHFGVFSFYGNKIITTGEGGMLTTNDAALFQRAKLLRDHAMSPTKRYWHPERGFNYRMTNLQAALGLAQMERIDEVLEHRQQLFRWYSEGINTDKHIRLNYQAPWAKNVYWLICLEIDWLTEQLRNQFMEALKKAGVDSRPFFYTISSMPMYQDKPASTALAKSTIGLNLPTYFQLTRKDVLAVSKIINDTIQSIKIKADERHASII
ncbi:MAG TPA: DegT/DnrJ/EryC1/StrS family aminotransferase [Chryseosolibacter sp.]